MTNGQINLDFSENKYMFNWFEKISYSIIKSSSEKPVIELSVEALGEVTADLERMFFHYGEDLDDLGKCLYSLSIQNSVHFLSDSMFLSYRHLCNFEFLWSLESFREIFEITAKIAKKSSEVGQWKALRKNIDLKRIDRVPCSIDTGIGALLCAINMEKYSKMNREIVLLKGPDRIRGQFISAINFLVDHGDLSFNSLSEIIEVDFAKRK